MHPGTRCACALPTPVHTTVCPRPWRQRERPVGVVTCCRPALLFIFFSMSRCEFEAGSKVLCWSDCFIYEGRVRSIHMSSAVHYFCSLAPATSTPFSRTQVVKTEFREQVGSRQGKRCWYFVHYLNYKSRCVVWNGWAHSPTPSLTDYSLTHSLAHTPLHNLHIYICSILCFLSVHKSFPP